jgi:hypothetical protein
MTTDPALPVARYRKPRKSRTIGVRFTDEEADRLTRIAARRRLTLSEHVRRTALGNGHGGTR